MSSATPKKPSPAAIRASERQVGANDVAPPDPLPESPESVLSRTSTTLNELEALDARSFDLINIEEVEMRIGLLARIIIEHNLRRGSLTARDKCDIALRAITVLEGSKQEVTWRDELKKKPKPTTLTAYTAERAKTEERLKSILLRRQEVKVAAAEAALEELQPSRQSPPTDKEAS